MVFVAGVADSSVIGTTHDGMDTRSRDVKFGDDVARLKRELRKETERLIAEFAREHGVTPTSIRVTMLEVTSAGSSRREYVIGDVVIDFGPY